MHQQIRTFANEFVIILVIMIAIALVVFHINDNANTSVTSAVGNHLEKINLSQELFANASGRALLVQSYLLKKDSTTLDRMVLDKLAHNHTLLGEQLLPMLNAKEGKILFEINQLNHRITELYGQVSVLFENGNHNEALKIMRLEAMPLTNSMMQKFALLHDQQRSNNVAVASMVKESSDENKLRFGLYATFTVLVSLLAAGLAVYFGLKMSRELDNIDDYLEEKVSERTETLLDTQKELIEDNNELARLASTDPLTGLFNRAYMNDILKREQSRYQRYGQPFGIIMIDIDHFKRINDSYGHDAGDLILTQTAKQLKAAVRNSDFVGRWGGEEFIICCTTIDIEDIESIAENIRAFIEETDFDIINTLTVSLGCAIIKPDEDIASLIKRSDIALYEAKNGGRNQTRVSAAIS